MRGDGPGLRLRLSLLSAALVIVTAASLGFLSSRISRSEYRRLESVVERGGPIDPAPLREALLAHHRSHGSWEDVGPVLEGLANGSTGGLILLSEDGRVLGAAPAALSSATITAAPDGALRIETDERGSRELRVMRGPSLRLEPPGGAPARLVPVPLERERAEDAGSAEPVETRFMRSVNRELLTAVAGVAAAGALLTFVLTGRLVRPLSELTERVRRLARGERTPPSPIARRDELGRLARAFDDLSAALDANERARRAMVSDVAHELRSPLTNLRGHLEALQDGLAPPTRDRIDALHAEVLALSRLVDDLQELTLADAGELRLTRRPVDVSEVAARVAEAFAPRLAASGGTLEVDVPGDLPAVDADPDRLAQVLRNLVENAVTHGASGSSARGGRVTIRASREGSVVSLRVSDDGPGIPPGQLERVFDRFHRVDASRSRGSGGAGLGLAIVRSLVAAHGGTVRATSGGADPGATFVTTWPVTENAQAGPTFPSC